MSTAPSPQHLVELATARVAAAKIRRVVAVANFDGWSTLVLGGIGMIFSLGSPAGFLLGIAMVAIGWRQLNVAKTLGRLDITSPNKLAMNQIFLCAAVVLYAGWSLYRSMNSPGEIAQTIAANPELAQQLGAFSGMESSITVIVYVGVIVGSILVMGSTAWYYQTRAKVLANYVAQTPAWILEMQRNGDAL